MQLWCDMKVSFLFIFLFIYLPDKSNYQRRHGRMNKKLCVISQRDKLYIIHNLLRNSGNYASLNKVHRYLSKKIKKNIYIVKFIIPT